jgi:hypothetical protein
MSQEFRFKGFSKTSDKKGQSHPKRKENKLIIVLKQIGHADKLEKSNLVKLFKNSQLRQFSSVLKKSSIADCKNCSTDFSTRLIRNLLRVFYPELNHQLSLIINLTEKKIISEEESIFLLKTFIKTSSFISSVNDKTQDNKSRCLTDWVSTFEKMFSKMVELSNEITSSYIVNQIEMKEMGITSAISTPINF